MIVRTDSQYVHQEVIETAMAHLHNAQFEVTLTQFMEAHKRQLRVSNKTVDLRLRRAWP